MLLEYQITIDDFREMIIAAGQTDQKQTRFLRTRNTIILYGVLLSFMGLFWLDLRTTDKNNALTAAIDAFLPGTTIFLFWAVFKIARVLRGGRKLRWNSTMSGVVLLAVALTLGIRRGLSEPTRNPLPPVTWSVLGSHLAWIVIITVAGVFIILRDGRALRDSWEGQAILHRPMTADISVDGVAFSDAVCNLTYRWDAIQRWEETQNLFLLYLGRFNVFMLPKRAFKSEEEQAAFRNMVRIIMDKSSVGFPVAAINA